MTFNEAKIEFTINNNFIDKSIHKYDYTEHEISKLILDIASGLNYCTHIHTF